MALHEEIKAIRTKLGMDHKQFAKKLGISGNYAINMEKPPKKGKRLYLPSVELLKKMARIAGSTPEERQFLERKLLFERHRLIAPKEIQDTMDEKFQAVGTEQGMPWEFIERLKQDLKNFPKTDDNFLKDTGILREVLELVLSGRYVLNRTQVISLAMKLKQPVDHYLLLAGYIPEEIKDIITQKRYFGFFRQLTKLSPEETEKILFVLEDILKLLKKEAQDEKR